MLYHFCVPQQSRKLNHLKPKNSKTRTYVLSHFLSTYITVCDPIFRYNVQYCTGVSAIVREVLGIDKFKQLIMRGNLLICVSVPKETSRDLKHLLMGLLQRNHRERISFGKPLSFPSYRIYEQICFRVWLLNLFFFFFFLHSQKSFFTTRSWSQVHPQRNVGMRPCCVQSSLGSGKVLLQILTRRFHLSLQLRRSFTQVQLQPVLLVAHPHPTWPPLRWVSFILLYTCSVCACIL